MSMFQLKPKHTNVRRLKCATVANEVWSREKERGREEMRRNYNELNLGMKRVANKKIKKS